MASKPSNTMNRHNRRDRWHGYVWRLHFLYYAFPAALLVSAASGGASALAARVAQLVCWAAAILIQQWLIPQIEDEEFSLSSPIPIQLWPLGLWHNSQLSGLWIDRRQGPFTALMPALGNLAVAFVSAIFLGLMNVKSSWSPIALAGPWTVDDQPIQAFTAFWWLGQFGHVNWVIGLVSLLPAAPLAGVHLVNYFFEAAGWHELEAARIRRLIAIFTLVFCDIVGIWLVSKDEPAGFLAIGIGLMIAIETRKQYLFDRSMQFFQFFISEETAEKRAEAALRDDDEMPGVFFRLRQFVAAKRREVRDLQREKRREDRILEHQRLDRLLAHIHSCGLKSLGWRDRRFLRKMARRKRQQKQNPPPGPHKPASR
ncbi:MAG: hypothetical protein ACKO0V_23760 [bacterium]